MPILMTTGIKKKAYIEKLEKRLENSDKLPTSINMDDEHQTGIQQLQLTESMNLGQTNALPNLAEDYLMTVTEHDLCGLGTTMAFNPVQQLQLPKMLLTVAAGDYIIHTGSVKYYMHGIPCLYWAPAKAGPSKRSPIRPPDLTPVPIPPRAEPAELPQIKLAEAPAQQTPSLSQDKGTSRSFVRQKDTKSSRFDPLSRPGLAKAGPSKRSPIRPPGFTIAPSTPRAEPAEEPSRRSRIHPPNQPQAPQVPEILEIPSTFTEERPVRQIQELVLNQAENLAQQTTGNALQDEDTNRRPPLRRFPIFFPGFTSSRLTENAKRKAIIRQRREARDQARIQSLLFGSEAQARSRAGFSSQASSTSRTKNRVRQPKRSLIFFPGPIGPVPTTSRVETTRKEPPSQPQVPHSPEISEDPSTFTDERRASQLQELVLDQTADTQQTNNLPQDEERNRDNRRLPGQRDRSRGRPRGRSPSSRSLDSRNRRTRPTGGRSRSPIRSPIAPPGLTTRACSPLRAERTREEPSRRSQIYPPSHPQAPQVPEIPEIPSMFTDEHRAS
ncbi:hypothetical protein F5Y03DRAFT_403155 [Xylaria venustula]|nr:hypothetical protein F5Y03DRAFT_403155 [Xylaria venustula]